MRRKDSVSRTEKEAHTFDIINATYKLDKANTMPTVLIDAYELHIIPRSHPEELNNISLVDRLNHMERKMSSMQEIIDRTVAENMSNPDKVNNLIAGSSTEVNKSVP